MGNPASLLERRDMIEYKMTEEKRKVLTEWMGECWHEEDIEYTKKAIRDPRHRSVFAICSKCKKTYGRSKRDRTFTTDADMMAVFRAIRDKGIWNQFEPYCWKKSELKGLEGLDEFMPWLFLDNPERACCLAAMFLEEQG